MSGRAGALCLPWYGANRFPSNPDASHGNEDRHKAPTSTLPLSLSLQKASERLTASPISRLFVILIGVQPRQTISRERKVLHGGKQTPIRHRCITSART